MNPNTDNPNHPELNGQLETAVCAVLSDPIPADAIERVKQRAHNVALVQASTTTPQVDSRQYPVVLRFAVAASVLAVIVGSLALIGIPLGNSNVYAQAVKRLDSLSSMVCQIQFSSTGNLNELVNTADSQRVTYLAPSRHRIEDERLRTVQIIDRKQNRIVLLQEETKQAIVMEGPSATVLDATSPARVIEALLEHFRIDRIDDETVKSLGTQMRDGATLEGYESTLGGEVVRAWFDVESLAPAIVAVRFEIPAHMNDGESVPMWRVMTDIQMNVDVNPDQFSTTVPYGFEPLIVDEVSQDLSPASLDDVIEMLRLCAQANQSKFPLWLSIDDSTGTQMEILSKFAGSLENQMTNGTESEKAAALKSAQEFGAATGRAIAFQFSMKPDNDWNYFGGAKLNQPNRPLLWYAPDADDQYTIVYADLTTTQVTRDELPAQPDAVVRPEVSRKTVRVSTPRFTLPANVIDDFAKLQAIRDSGQQAEVEYLDLGRMREFTESQVTFVPGEEIVMQEVDPNWKPNRNGNSSRLAFLKEFTNLKGLNVMHLYLTQNDLDTIGSLASLQRLSLSGVYVFDSSSRRLTGNDLAKLSSLESLELLDLSQSNFAGGLKHLHELPRFHTLYLSSSEHLNDATVSELSVLPNLETLVLAPVYATNPKTTVTDAGLASLKDLRRLKTLYVGYHGKWTLPVDQLRELLPGVDVRSPTEGVSPAR
ncbi:MAG: hypothetical protein WBD31_21520 [Rubripirellula sp.]